MSREFGIYPTNREPQMWIGCRAIITERRFDVPYDRWSTDIKYESGKEDFVWWINNVAIPKLEVGIREGRKSFGSVLKMDSLPVKLTTETAVVISTVDFIAQKNMTK